MKLIIRNIIVIAIIITQLKYTGALVGAEISGDNTVQLDLKESWCDEVVSFLCRFPSMFVNEKEMYNVYWKNLEYHEVPYDYRNFHYAPYSYQLFDLNRDGVLEIVMSFGVIGTDEGFDVLYQYIDGAYKEVSVFYFARFYTDKDGRLVIGDGGEAVNGYNYQYAYAYLEDNGIEIEVIIDKDGYNHLTNSLVPYDELMHNDAGDIKDYRIPGMADKPLYEILPMDIDYESVKNSVNELVLSYSTKETDLITIIGCDGRVETNVPIIIQNGRMLVPGRLIGVALRATDKWSNISETLTVTKEDREVRIYLDSTEALINGEATTMEVPMQIINNVVMVPIRFAAEALNLDVSWDSNTKTLEISKL